MCGNSSIDRAGAFQASGCGFDSHFPLQNSCAGRSMVDRIVVADKMNGFDSHPALHSRVMKWQTCSPQKRDFVGSNPTSATIRESSNG